MPYDIPLLLLPLVGGYFILAKSIFFHHTYKRIGSQKLIFDSIIAGIILSLITWLIRKMFYFLFPSFAGHTYEIIRNFSSPYHVELIGTTTFCFMFSLIFVFLINNVVRIFARKKFIFEIFSSAVLKLGDELEQFFLHAFVFRKLIMITLKNNKIYIGYIATINEPQKTNYIEIFPRISGYRKPISKVLKFTAYYEKVLEKENEKEKLIRIIIKKDEILTATRFYPEIYSKFQELAKTEKESYNKDAANPPTTQPSKN